MVNFWDDIPLEEENRDSWVSLGDAVQYSRSRIDLDFWL